MEHHRLPALHGTGVRTRQDRLIIRQDLLDDRAVVAERAAGNGQRKVRSAHKKRTMDAHVL